MLAEHNPILAMQHLPGRERGADGPASPAIGGALKEGCVTSSKKTVMPKNFHERGGEGGT